MNANAMCRLVILMGFFAACARARAAGPAYPLKIGPTGRYLVDQKGKPFLIAGESPQAMMVNVSENDAERFFANRRSHGFNAAWINLICAKYTGGREDASTADGLRPFATQYDFSQPNDAYFARCDRIIRLAAKYDTLVILDPAETGSFLERMQKCGEPKCREYGRYLGRRYANFDNLLWMHGNDYGQHTPENDKLVMAIAEGIKEFDSRHLHTTELNVPDVTSLDDGRWTPVLGLSGAYNYGPVYLPILRDYNRKTDRRIPTFMQESSYEFEHLSGARLGDPRQLRLQEYTSDLCGTTGQLYGNKYTWPFLSGWQDKLDTPGAVQMKYVQALFEPRAWYELAPDQDHKVLTDGFGKFGDYDYAPAARTPDGSLVLAYLPDARTVTVDMSKLAGPATARWYDPASGEYREIDGSPLPSHGHRPFTPPGNNADGPENADWVLVLETRPPS